MKKLSRRNFFKLSLCLTISGLAIMYRQFFNGNKVLEALAKTVLDFEPAYLKLHKSGELRKRGKKLWEIMESCAICPRGCGVNRLEGNKGFCHASSQLEVSSYHPHFGEEQELVGRGGSGTIFFTNCGYARFSFLLSTPIIFVATALKIKDIFILANGQQSISLFLGFSFQQ